MLHHPGRYGRAFKHRLDLVVAARMRLRMAQHHRELQRVIQPDLGMGQQRMARRYDHRQRIGPDHLGDQARGDGAR